MSNDPPSLYAPNLLSIREETRTKFFEDVCRLKEEKTSNQILWGWGNNNAGQLGLPGSALSVKHPLSVPLPDLLEDEEIEKIECSFRSSAILTTNNRVFLSEPAGKLSAKRKISPKSDKKKSKGGKHKAKVNDGDQEETQLTKRNENRWTDITSASTYLE